MPRWLEARKVTFKYALGEEFIDVLRTLHRVGLDRTEPVRVKGVEVSPRDVVAAARHDAELAYSLLRQTQPPANTATTSAMRSRRAV